MSHMTTIGVRELRRDASRWLARVRSGERITITDRGRPIAYLSPVAEPGGYDHLLATGRIAPGRGRPLDDLLDEIDRELPDEPGPPLSAALEELRRDER